MADNLSVLPTAEQAGKAAGGIVGDVLFEAVRAEGRARVIFASAPSQEMMLRTVSLDPRLDWESIQSFHMDEYLGLEMNRRENFGSWLSARLPASGRPRLNRIRTDVERMEESTRYVAALEEHPINLACVGIGVNGHLAFNEPGDTDFDDHRWMRHIDLDEVSRQQQVDDGLFETLHDVPHSALTLTVPALLSAKRIVCSVVGPQKAAAVRHALMGPVSTDCPASILQTHPAVSWFVDAAAASEIPGDRSTEMSWEARRR